MREGVVLGAREWISLGPFSLVYSQVLHEPALVALVDLLRVSGFFCCVALFFLRGEGLTKEEEEFEFVVVKFK